SQVVYTLVWNETVAGFDIDDIEIVGDDVQYADAVLLTTMKSAPRSNAQREQKGEPCTQHVTDGGFEAGVGSGNWVETSTQFGSPLCTQAVCGVANPHVGGEVFAWFGGTTGVEIATLAQQVTIAPGTATLSYDVTVEGAGAGQM